MILLKQTNQTTGNTIMKIKKTFDQRVKEVTTQTVEFMICNAMNNSPTKGNKVFTSATNETFYKELFGGRVVMMSDVTREEKIAALESYKAKTDWSAFKKWDWQAAMNTLVA